MADVHVYRYGSDDVVWPLVDLESGAVVGVSVEKFQPRLVGEEIAEAEEAVLSDPRVLKKIGSAEGVAIIAVPNAGPDERGPCVTHRCVEIIFFRDDAELGVFALFDLSTLKVEGVWGAGENGGSRTEVI